MTQKKDLTAQNQQFLEAWLNNSELILAPEERNKNAFFASDFYRGCITENDGTLTMLLESGESQCITVSNDTIFVKKNNQWEPTYRILR